MALSPEQQYSLAKTLPIPELAKVLQGQSDVVDMWVAESMLRQKTQAQKAQQGMAAQQMANAPKVVQRDLAAAQQLMQPAQQLAMQQVPQPRMEQGVGGLAGDVDISGYADGGIVAFDDGGEVQRFQNKGYVNPYGLYTGLANPEANLLRLTPEEIEEQKRLKEASFTEALRHMYRKFGEPVVDYLTQSPLSAGGPRSREIPLAASLAPVSSKSEDKTETTADKIQYSPGYLRGLEAKDKDSYVTGPATTPPYIPRNMQMGDVTKAPAAASSFDALMSQADKALNTQYRPPMTTMENARENVGEIEKYLAAAGYDPKFFEKQREEIEKKKGDTKADREEAGWTRLLEAGLGILGGESPYAFVNVGKGASPALKGFQEDIKEINKLNREYDKAIRDVNIAEQSNKKEMGLAALKRAQEIADKREEKKFELAKTMYTVQAQERIAAMPGATERIINRMNEPAFAEQASKYFKMQQGSAGRVDAAILQDYAKNPWKLEALKDTDINMYNYIKAQLAAMSVPSAVSAPIGTVRQ